MIGKLKGIIDALGDDHVEIDVGGVVYLAFCSGKTLDALPPVGEAATLYVEMVVREDMIRLYGFATFAEKTWFITLMTVQGVGARVALAILSVLTVGELQSAIALDDKATIGRASGVGPKLATRITSELQGKIPAGALDLRPALGAKAAPSNVADAISALSNLGYSATQASAAVAKVVALEGEGTPTDKLIRLGLRELSV